MTPVPHPSESENAFSIRAHRELMSSIPDTDRRNAAVFSAWRKHRGMGELEQQGIEKYGADCVHVRDVPVWAEHETVDRQGNPIKVELDDLLAVCDRCNYRIADTGDFSPLTFGHTPTKEQREKGMQPPEVGGYAGPFRIGMIGAKEPRWAIFTDEHRMQHKEQRIRECPRRSPEVWLHPDRARRFMDPIAMLGSETPRLDLGMRYGKIGELEVERYAAAEGGACNVFVPGHVAPGDRKERYEEPTVSDSDKEPLMLTPEDIQQIVAAIGETKWGRWAMEQAEQAASPGADDMPPVPGADAPPAPPAPPVPPADDKEKPMQYSRAEQDLIERYSKLAEVNAGLQGRINALEGINRETIRKSRLQTLRQSRAFDMDEEVLRCSKMSDEAFDDHATVIEKHYPQISTDITLPTPGNYPPPAGASEQYAKEAELVGKAVAWVKAERAAGRNPTTAEAYEKFGVKTS